jgi:hypothetical protein
MGGHQVRAFITQIGDAVLLGVLDGQLGDLRRVGMGHIQDLVNVMVLAKSVNSSWG